MASVDDIRVTVAWRDHPKRQKLQRRLGAEGVLALMDLWLWAGANRPAGILTGMNEEDVEIACGWRGVPGALVPVLIDLRLLDYEGGEQDEGTLSMHDWHEHQGWATGAAARSEASRKAARAKWDRRNAARTESDADGNAPASTIDACRTEPHSPFSISISVSDPNSDPVPVPPAPARDPAALPPASPPDPPPALVPDDWRRGLVERWIAATGVAELAPQGISELADLCDHAARALSLAPAALFDRAVVEYRAYRETCSPGRVPGLSPRKLREHWPTVVERITGAAPTGTAAPAKSSRVTGPAEVSDFSHLPEST